MKNLFMLLIISIVLACNSTPKPEAKTSEPPRFNIEKDLLLANYDCKTDVDDLHSIAALGTLIRSAEYNDLKYHAVAGAYGVQEGLYVPPNELFELAFGHNWTDAHPDRKSAVQAVKSIVVETIENGGQIWIAEAGQSNFSSSLLKVLMYRFMGKDLTKYIHIVQHSEWNESVTDSVALAYVKQFADYHKIPDGNALGNGTPGFKDSELIDFTTNIVDAEVKSIWKLADEICMKYNGVDDRYLNEAIKAGGVDFSDFSEVCWILEIDDLLNAKDFFEQYME